MTTTNSQSLEKRTVRKTMLRILPFVIILNIIAYVDRVNFGYAALDMNADLALTAEVFGIASGIFFIGYILFEIPSNMVMAKVGAKLWISRIMITWGLVVVLMGFSQTALHLYILRFLLGVAEAGFFPGIILYLTFWFRKKDRALATSMFLISVPVSGIIGGPLSTWIMDTVHWGNLAGWRWMLILEGAPAILLGIFVLFYLKNRPKEAKWLTKEESKWLEGELEKERIESSQVNKTSKMAMIKNANVWKLAFVYFAQYTAMYGLAFWLPSIIQSFSVETTSNIEIGWLSMIPALVGLPAVIFMGWNSSRTNLLKEHIIACFIIAIIGFTVSGFATSSTTMIIMLSFAAIGLYGFGGIFMAYMTFFFTSSTAPVGIALVNSFAAIGGFVGPVIFGLLSPNLGMFTLAGLAIGGLIILKTLHINNKQLDNKSNKTEIVS